MANKNLCKPIIELDKPNGKPVAYWGSSKEAAEHYGIGQVNISYNINNITKQAKGHYFRYATKQETAAYNASVARIDAVQNIQSAPVAPVAPITPTPVLPVETIPEVVHKPSDTLTPFQRMVQESKKKFNENSE